MYTLLSLEFVLYSNAREHSMKADLGFKVPQTVSLFDAELHRDVHDGFGM